MSESISRKICTKCLKDLPVEEFGKRGNGLQSNCRSCKKDWYDNYYRTDPKEKARLLAKNKINREKAKDFVRSAKEVPCADCRAVYPYYVMDFDHLGDKEFNISTAVNTHSIARLKKEIAKCEVVCSNCHRVRTHNRIK